MAVFTFKALDTIMTGVRHLAARLTETSNLVLTPDEFITGFIDPQHVEPLMTTQRLVGHVGYSMADFNHDTIAGTQFTLRCSFGGSSSPIIIPSYVKKGLQPTAPEDVRAKIQSWLEERARIGELFGDALDAVNYLNDHCGNQGAFMALFPALPTVFKVGARGDQKAEARAKKMSESTSLTGLPRLPVEVKRRINECSEVLMNLTMVDPNESRLATKRQHADISMYSRHTPRPDFIYAAITEDATVKVKPAAFV